MNKCEIKVGQTALSEKVFYHWWDSEADAEANADVEADEANSTTPCIIHASFQDCKSLQACYTIISYLQCKQICLQKVMFRFF